MASHDELTFEKMARMLEAHDVYAVVAIDRKLKICCWNRGAEIITCFTKEEAVGNDICIFFTDLDRERQVPEQEVRQAVRVGKAEDERWHQRKDGSKFWAVGALTPLRDEKGNLIGFCKMFRDDTAKKVTEESIHTANAELNRFSQTAAHDLQQPIRTIANYIQLAMQSTGDSPKLLQTALDASLRLKTLTKDLLSYAKSGKRTEDLRRVDCNTALDLAVENLKVDIDESQALVHRGSLPEIIGVPTQIQQVFQNLIINSIKYRHPERVPLVFIDAEKVQGAWQFCVTDNGKGIEKEYQSKIFEAFERIPNGGEGSGLGLPIVKRIIQAHGGALWVESEPEKGSRFFFTIKDS